jgi:hypothetical protein
VPRIDGLDGAPVHPAGGVQRGDLAGRQFDQVDAGEESAVEPGDVFEQEVAAALHGPEEFAERGAELHRVGAALGHDALEKLFGQQADVFGEHAEQTLDQEVRDLLRVVATAGHRLGDVGEAAGGIGGDLAHRATGAEPLGVGEQPAQLPQVVGRADVLEADGVRLRRGAGEMGVDLGDVAVADDEQRRVVECQRVGHQLLEGATEVAARTLVLPAEMPALPHIRPAMPGAGARRAAFETIVVGIVRGLDAEQGAQIEEEGLRAGTLGKRVVAPFGDELAGGHGRSAERWRSVEA